MDATESIWSIKIIFLFLYGENNANERIGGRGNSEPYAGMNVQYI